MMIAGFEEPTARLIELGGEDLTGASPTSRNIGVVFQNYALFPHMTVRRNVAFPLRMRGCPRDAIRPRACDRDPRPRRPAAVRRALSRASSPAASSSASPSPAPSSSSPTCSSSTSRSAPSTRTCASRCRSRSSASTARSASPMVYVTHDQTEAMTMSDRVVVLNHGTDRAGGAAARDLHRPATRFVGEFIGDSNVFAGASTRRRRRVTLDGLGPDPGRCPSVPTHRRAHRSTCWCGPSVFSWSGDGAAAPKPADDQDRRDRQLRRQRADARAGWVRRCSACGSPVRRPSPCEGRRP